MTELRTGGPKSRKARRTYDSLVAATRSVIAEDASFNATIVTERAGVAPATFYAYFASKDDALAAAFDVVLGDLNERAAAALDIERLLDKSLRAVTLAVIRAVVDVFRADALVFRLAVARMPESRLLRATYRRRQREGQVIIRRFIQLGQSAGRIRAADGDALATALLVTLQGYNNPILLAANRRDPALGELAGMLEGLLSPTMPEARLRTRASSAGR